MRKALFILADLDDLDLAWMVRVGSHRLINAGAVLIREGEPIDTMYIVIDGTLDVTVGAGQRVAELSRGDIVGEMSLIEKRPPSATVRATGDCRLLCVPQDAIQQRLGSEPAFGARFYRALAVFLSDRLRTTVATLGYGATRDGDRQTILERENELDEAVLDGVHVAGDRMSRLIAMLDRTH